MTKTAIFVEGQTELIFVRECLLKKYDYRVNLECYELYRGDFRPAEYNYSSPGSGLHYEIINIGCDEKVLSVIVERAESMIKNGYVKLIGLRDMYSEKYCQLSNIIDEKLNIEIIEAINEEVKAHPANSHIKICIAIMEVEAWFLAMCDVFLKMFNELKQCDIEKLFGVKIINLDPETAFFQPSVNLNQIYQLVNSEYRKKKGDVEKICSLINKADLEVLNEVPKCGSFTEFYNQI